MVKLAGAHGVNRVAKRPLSVAGLSMPIGTGRAILVNDSDTPVRQRFTLAHEIAHLFLDEETTREVWLRTPRGQNHQAHRTLETFCDDLASRILMPRAWLERDLKGKSPMPSLLLKLADQYGVSRQAFCIRAINFLGGAYHVAEWCKTTDSHSQSSIRRTWQAAARGMSRLMPEETTMHSPVGHLLQECLADHTASYSGELVREHKSESVEMRACLLQKGPHPTMIAVTRRSKARQKAKQLQEQPCAVSTHSP